MGNNQSSNTKRNKQPTRPTRRRPTRRKQKTWIDYHDELIYGKNYNHPSISVGNGYCTIENNTYKVFMKMGRISFVKQSVFQKREYHLEIFHKIKRETIKTTIEFVYDLIADTGKLVRMLPTGYDHIIEFKNDTTHELVDLEEVIKDEQKDEQTEKEINDVLSHHGIQINLKDYKMNDKKKYDQQLSQFDKEIQINSFFKFHYGIDISKGTTSTGITDKNGMDINKRRRNKNS